MSILQAAALILVGLLAGLALGALRAHRLDRSRSRRVDALTSYLEKASLGQAATLLPSGEDDLSRLQDEIGKTVTALQRTRTQAVQAKEGYARNLSSIAHQIKTPLTAISLTVQSIETAPASSARQAKIIEGQVERMTQLQEDLILMAKLDAGVLQMRPATEDAFTLMAFAAENVEALAAKAGVAIEVAEGTPVEVQADGHWTVEALTNIMKNCLEHSPAGAVVRGSYQEDPLFVRMLIVDEGCGFAPEERRRLFERFHSARSGPAQGAGPGTGLGLAFARELMELQGGSLQAGNRPQGGAWFEIRIRRHPTVT